MDKRALVFFDREPFVNDEDGVRIVLHIINFKRPRLDESRGINNDLHNPF